VVITHTLARALPGQAADESLNILPLDRMITPSLRLNVHGVETQLVFLDNAVDTLVSGLADHAGLSVCVCASVPHLH
jgi:hypothetical protein